MGSAVPQQSLWEARTLLAVAGSARLVDDDDVLREVALRFADHFDPVDREYDGLSPRWHVAVRTALAALIDRGDIDASSRRVVAANEERLASARDEVLAAERRYRETTGPVGSGASQADRDAEPLLISGCITPALRPGTGSPTTTPIDERTPMPVMVELNLKYQGGPEAAFKQLRRLWERLPEVAQQRDQPDGADKSRRRARAEGVLPVADEYATMRVDMSQVKRLVAADAVPIVWPGRSIYRVWPDFPVDKHIDASSVTVKADAAQRSFNAYGRGIVWAVIDSGIDGKHAHFKANHTLDHDDVRDLHRYFPGMGRRPTREGARVDEDGHGTHVAGIIAGGLEGWHPAKAGDGDIADRIFVTEDRFNVENPRQPLRMPREVPDAQHRLAGMAPLAHLVSLKVMDAHSAEQTPENRVSRVMEALAYVRQVNAQNSKSPRIHGVNLSLGYDFNPTWFACGRSPLCQEVDKLVRTGVVVVVAAGNSGFGALRPDLADPRSFGMVMTINDPGNARLAITVGSTHRDSPHAYGVSYFSSKGPTGDGRRKPDLVAPGERITSAATGQLAAAVALPDGKDRTALYVEQSGTSMSAPHVSGAVAAFLSVRREFIGDPERVKQIFLDSATSLDREPYVEGAGLVDLMRALQSV
jgi:serine protease AprX